jgi:pyruvate dehydrogenase E2 component (dihydrolipoamide acetyltransferase)
MACEIRVPRLGWSMEEGTFLRWLKRDGETVRAGEPLYELEGEKATQEIESIDAGILRIPPHGPIGGTTVAVGALLGYLCAEGESMPAGKAVAWGESARPTFSATSTVVGLADSAHPTPAHSTRIISSPRARRVAAELGVDWRQLNGTGRDGRIRESDVRAAAPKTSSRRRTIAERMLASQQLTAPVTLTTRADATQLVVARQKFQSRGELLAPAYTDFVACLVAEVLKSHRQLAGRWDDRTQQNVLPGDDSMHIGIAVDTEQGLLVPVIRNVAAMAVKQVAERSRALVEAARSGQLAAAEMQDAVFTITNLGAYGIDAFTPIINYPETAILGVGAIRLEPVVLDSDRIEPRYVIALSLTFDHCRVDGAPAARFLRAVCAALEGSILDRSS